MTAALFPIISSTQNIFFEVLESAMRMCVCNMHRSYVQYISGMQIILLTGVNVERQQLLSILLRM